MQAILPELYMMAYVSAIGLTLVVLAIWETRRFDRRWGKPPRRSVKRADSSEQSD